MNCAESAVVAAAALSAALAKGRSAEELSLLGNLLMMVGQNLATMVEIQSIQGE